MPRKGRLRIRGNKSKAYQQVSDDISSTSKNTKKKRGRRNTKDKKNSYCGDYELRQMIEAGSGGKREIVEMESDGNCLFRSISHQLYEDFGDNHEEVRNEICDYLEENKVDFEIFLVPDDDTEDVMDFDDYVTEMRDDATWGGDVEIVCAARLYKRQITIFSSSGAYNIGIGDEKPSGPDILLSFHENSHYNSVDSVDEDSLHESPVDQEGAETKINESAEKINRPVLKKNDLCHCGSGRKYKKCCLIIDKSRIQREKFRTRNGSVEATSEEGTTDDSHEEEMMVGYFKKLTI